MPAGSDPHTWRPLGVRLAGTFFTVLLFLVCAAAWLGFEPEVRDKFTIPERGTALLLGVAVVAIIYALGRCRLTIDGDRVTVINGYRRRDLERAQVVALWLPSGAPWAVMDLDDGTSVPVMGIQASDGPRAKAAIRAARELLSRSGG